MKNVLFFLFMVVATITRAQVNPTTQIKGTDGSKPEILIIDTNRVSPTFGKFIYKNVDTLIAKSIKLDTNRNTILRFLGTTAPTGVPIMNTPPRIAQSTSAPYDVYYNNGVRWGRALVEDTMVIQDFTYVYNGASASTIDWIALVENTGNTISSLRNGWYAFIINMPKDSSINFTMNVTNLGYKQINPGVWSNSGGGVAQVQNGDVLFIRKNGSSSSGFQAWYIIKNTNSNVIANTREVISSSYYPTRIALDSIKIGGTVIGTINKMVGTKVNTTTVQIETIDTSGFPAQTLSYDGVTYSFAKARLRNNNIDWTYNTTVNKWILNSGQVLPKANFPTLGTTNTLITSIIASEDSAVYVIKKAAGGAEKYFRQTPFYTTTTPLATEGANINNTEAVWVNPINTGTENETWNVSNSKWLPVNDVTLNTISDLTAYTGNALEVKVLDSLRGGDFKLRTLTGNTVNNITVFTSAISGYAWIRDISNANLWNVDWAGADPTGVGNSTTAIQSIIDLDKGVQLGFGTYKVDTLFTHTNTKIIGKGIGLSILTPLAANQKLIHQSRNAIHNGVSDNLLLEGFTVKAHASGSTEGSIYTTGARNARYENIGYESNGTGSYNTLFDVSASPYLCYNPTFRKIKISDQTGIKKAFYFNNNNTNAFGNANQGLITESWFVNNTSMDTIIEGVRSAKWTISNTLFEANTNAVAINSGNSMTIKDNWFELNLQDIAYKATGGSSPNSGLVISNYFSNAHTINLTDALANVWVANTEVGAQTWINNASGVNTNTRLIQTEDWGITGRAGTTAGTNFIGTTDGVDFVTKVNNVEVTRAKVGGNFGIGTGTNIDSKLTLNTAANSNINAITLYNNNGAIDSYTAIGSYYTSGNTNVNSQIRFGNELLNGSPSYIALATGTTNTATEKLRIQSTGRLRLTNYLTTTSFPVTAVGQLVFDASGNIGTAAVVSTTTALPQGSATTIASTTQTVTLDIAPTFGTSPSRFDVWLESGGNRPIQFPLSLDSTAGYTLSFTGSTVTVVFALAIAAGNKIYVKQK